MFITNLRPQTHQFFSEHGFSPSAWLLSSHRATPETLLLASAVRAQGRPLMADNGTKDLIEVLLARFEGEARDVRSSYHALKRGLPDGRRIPHPREIPAALRLQASALASRVLVAADELYAEIDDEAQTGMQLAMAPTHLIAKEDFAVAALLGLGLERELLGWRLDAYDRRNRRTLEGWQRVRAVVPPDVRVYATLGAVDYSSARRSGELAVAAGADSVAIGFVGLNADTTYTDRVFLARRRRLSVAGPRRYVRLVEVLAGLRDGFAAAGGRLVAFHALGLGARPMFPLVRLVLGDGPMLSIDATSPLMDAVRDRVLYDDRNNGDRLTVRAAAVGVLEGRDDSPVPGGAFMQMAATELGHRPEAARQWWAEEGHRPLSWADLDPLSPLARYLSVYASGVGGVTSRQESFWVAHNHQVCEQIACSMDSVAAAAGVFDSSLASAVSMTVRNGLIVAREAAAMTRGGVWPDDRSPVDG